MWFILFNMAKVGQIYEPLGIKLGDFHPNNIIVTHDGFIRVITQHSLPEQLNNF
jgi:broad specificity phosphatase PhoE